MLRTFSISLLLTVFQTITPQPSSMPPEHCMRPPPGAVKPVDCCKVPRVFKDEDFKECGIEEPSTYKDEGPPDCSKNICLLKRYNLMKDDENVDKEALAGIFAKFAEDNPLFKDVMDKAKERCLSGYLPGPPQICEANKIGFCVLVTTFNECPTWEDSSDCKKLKDHMNVCKAYLPF